MSDVDAGGGDRLALAVLTQYRMATTEQMHRVIAPGVRIEQTRRRMAKLRDEGLVDRITLPRAGRLRVWFPTSYGAQIASEWPELRGRRPPKTVSDPTAARLRVGHTLTVTETALAFLEHARRSGDLCRPLDWIPEVHHSLGGGEAVIPDALMYYRRGPADGDDGAMLRAFIEVDRATMGPERLSAKIGAYARLHRYTPHTRYAPPTDHRAGPGAGDMATPLSALPSRPVRPGRHRPHRHHHTHPRPQCSCEGTGGGELPALRSRPRGIADRPAQQRTFLTGLAPCPRPCHPSRMEPVATLVVILPACTVRSRGLRRARPRGPTTDTKGRPQQVAAVRRSTAHRMRSGRAMLVDGCAVSGVGQSEDAQPAHTLCTRTDYRRTTQGRLLTEHATYGGLQHRR